MLTKVGEGWDDLMSEESMLWKQDKCDRCAYFHPQQTEDTRDNFRPQHTEDTRDGRAEIRLRMGSLSGFCELKKQNTGWNHFCTEYLRWENNALYNKVVKTVTNIRGKR